MLKILVGWSLLFISTQAFAETKCIPVQSVQELSQNLKLPDYTEADLCAPESQNYRLFETLLFMKNLRFDDKAVPSPLNQGLLPGNFWTYFMNYAKDVSNVTSEASCKGVLAFTIGALKDGIVYICPGFYADSTTLAERVSVLLHEVRHFDGHPHVTCKNNFNHGDGCDNSITDAGSWAISVEALAKMTLAAPDLDEHTRNVAKNLLMIYLHFVFNEPVVVEGGLSAVYLQSQDGKTAYLFNGAATFETAPLNDARVISRTFLLAAFPDDKSDCYSATLWSPVLEKLPPGGQFSIKYNQTPQDSRPDVVDILILPDINTLVQPHAVSVNALPPAAFTWTAKSTFTGPELGDADPNSLYVLDTNDQLHQVTWDSYSVTIVDAPARTKGLVSISILNGVRFALTADGDVVTFGADNQTWIPYPPLAGKKFKSMSRPFWWTSSLYKP